MEGPNDLVHQCWVTTNIKNRKWTKVEYEDLSKLQKSSKIQDFQRKWIIFVVKNCLTDSNMSKVEF